MIMRTTIFLDDQLAKRLRAAAARRGISFSAFMADAGRRALKHAPAKAKPFRLITYGEGGHQPGVDLDRTSALLVAEDQEAYRGSR